MFERSTRLRCPPRRRLRWFDFEQPWSLAYLSDGNGLLFHHLVDGRSIVFRHLIELIDAANALICQYQSTSLEHELI